MELTRSDTTYDSYLRKAKITTTAGGVIQSRTDFSYDAFSRVNCTATRMNPALYATATTAACTLGAEGSHGPDRITRNTYDSFDRVIKVQTAYGLSYQRDEVTKTYGYNGEVSTIADAKGNLTTLMYDGFQRLVRTRYPSPTTTGQSSTTDYEEVTYDAKSQMTNRRLRDGKQIGYSYDIIGRQTLAHMVNPVDANDRDIASSYDLLDRVTQVDDGGGRKVQFGYDALGRKVSETPQLTGGVAATMQYDLAGRRTRLTWSDGFYVGYEYDAAGELTAVRENGATSGTGVLATFAYDDMGRRIGLARGNGTSDAYSYDAASRVVGLTLSHATAGNAYTYAYNPAGQLVSRAMTNDAYAWTQAVAVNRGYTTNGLNQYTASGSIVPSYDGRGNLTSAGPTAYLYDSKNKLTTFGTNSLGYDALGRLASQATPVTRFVYDDSDLIAETDGSNAIVRRYVHVPGSDEVLVWYEGSGTGDRRWLARDERGSTTLITDAGGAALAINAYDEYGIPQSTNLGRFQYTGQTWLPELGMYYYKARIYSATLGRFLQTDPTGYDDGPNWYNYVGGDPLNRRDPTGMDCTASVLFNNCKHFEGYAPTTHNEAMYDPDFSGTSTLEDYRNYRFPWLGEKALTTQNGDGFQLTAGALPPGNYARPAIGPNPLDPQFRNTPITPYELTRISNTMNLLANGDTSQVMNTLNPHYYGNIPDPITGARLPYDSRGYTSIDVLDFGRGGSNRLLFSNTPPTQTYYTNSHYRSFYYIGH